MPKPILLPPPSPYRWKNEDELHREDQNYVMLSRMLAEELKKSEVELLSGKSIHADYDELFAASTRRRMPNLKIHKDGGLTPAFWHDVTVAALVSQNSSTQRSGMFDTRLVRGPVLRSAMRIVV